MINLCHGFYQKKLEIVEKKPTFMLAQKKSSLLVMKLPKQVVPPNFYSGLIT